MEVTIEVLPSQVNPVCVNMTKNKQKNLIDMPTEQYDGGGFPYEVPSRMYVKFTGPSHSISTCYWFHSGYVLPMNVIYQRKISSTQEVTLPKLLDFIIS